MQGDHQHRHISIISDITITICRRHEVVKTNNVTQSEATGHCSSQPAASHSLPMGVDDGGRGTSPPEFGVGDPNANCPPSSDLVI